MNKRDTVTLARADYEALLDRIEDAEDRAAVAAFAAREKALGKEAARKDALAGDLVSALIAGAHPVRVWRKHRGLTVTQLADRVGMAQSYVTEIETGKKPGSLDAMRKIAAALGISLDDLVAWL
jgi:ribosome-binding protein aMBF1 (putative translation factor)